MTRLRSTSAAPHFISVILFVVQRALLYAIFILAGFAPGIAAQQQPASPAQSTSREPVIPQQAAPPQVSPPAPPHVGSVIVLDPAHGGTDTGARGNGVVEKDVVLLFARIAKSELERQGFRVVMTRNDDSNPSYDDRAAIANAYRDVVFVSFHVSSTGKIGTARTYYDQFWTPAPATSTTSPANPVMMPPSGKPSSPVPNASAANTLISWNEAQRPFAETSHHLADLLQGELTQRFSGSPVTALPAAVRGLRSVAGPAIAVEISSVAISDPNSFAAMAEPLAVSITRSLLAFHPANSPGSK
ncbi:MAG: N-acetylmuramoyl-L-alanine amidase [Candidatus Acidiferrales bacterium]